MNEINLKALVSYLKDVYSPSGKTDKGGRWYPDDIERCSCCASIRSPSRSYPWSIWKHCKSAKHIHNRITEGPSCELYTKALSMTLEDAPLFINDLQPALVAVAKKLLGR